ncbi:MAG: KH domain-containing protein [Thermoplasmata archaeon]
MREFVKYIASSLVDNPGAVRVREIAGPRETKLEVRVSVEDMGRIIGRGGRTVRAIRTLLAVAGRKSRRSFTMEIVQ